METARAAITAFATRMSEITERPETSAPARRPGAGEVGPALLDVDEPNPVAVKGALSGQESLCTYQCNGGGMVQPRGKPVGFIPELGTGN
ncbi:hypothetical protein Kisp01_64190 [Kineosporia sp. NBRC 101677]|nr:hypothetical protein Kisp01_64190 [Kineosporia sp. NBRC 101677]